MPLYRAFTEDFRRHMNQRSAWPPIKVVQPWFAEKAGGLRQKNYSHLKRGDTLNEKYAIGLIHLLLEKAAAHRPDHCAAVFLRYLDSRGVLHPARAPLSQVLDCVCQPAANHPSESAIAIDFMQRGMAAVGEVFNTRRLVHRYAQNCGNEAQVAEAINWLYVCLGRLARPTATDLSVESAIQIATDSIHIALEDYQLRAIEWWRFNPWTVVLARGNKKPNGVSIILPLSDDAYEAVLNGQQTSYDCRSHDLVVPTRNVLFEAVVERAQDLGAEPINPTRGLFANLMAQTAVFTHHANGARADKLRLLGFAGTPTQAKRMKAADFRPTGKKMRTTGVDFYENILNCNTTFGRNAILAGLLRHFGGILDGPPPD